jgi:hypothetical protein
VGDPCNTSSDCTQAGTNCAGSWCTLMCPSGSDALCGMNGAGAANYCVQDSTTLNFVCFPGCTSNADCTPFAGATCLSTGTGTQMVCSF